MWLWPTLSRGAWAADLHIIHSAVRHASLGNMILVSVVKVSNLTTSVPGCMLDNAARVLRKAPCLLVRPMADLADQPEAGGLSGMLGLLRSLQTVSSAGSASSAFGPFLEEGRQAGWRRGAGLPALTGPCCTRHASRQDPGEL